MVVYHRRFSAMMLWFLLGPGTTNLDTTNQNESFLFKLFYIEILWQQWSDKNSTRKTFIIVYLICLVFCIVCCLWEILGYALSWYLFCWKLLFYFLLTSVLPVCMYIYLFVCMYIMCVPNAHRGQKRVLIPWN